MHIVKLLKNFAFAYVYIDNYKYTIYKYLIYRRLQTF